LVNVAEESGATSLDPLFFIGMLLLLVALAFKIALVPFHMWTPDAYTGAPTAVVGFMATAVKAAGFAALIRVLFIALGPEPARIGAFGWVNILYWLAAITIVVGNLLAIAQNQLKRMLAYSSIAHAGYALVGVLAAGYIGAGVGDDASLGHLGNASVLFYLAAYALGVLGAFGLLSYLNRDGEDVQTYDDLDGFGVKHPALGLAMTVFMLSSAGFPATAGFVAKFFVFESAVTVSQQTGDPSFIYLVVLAVLASVAGAYYYLRVVVHMYMRPARGELGTAKHAPAATVIAICALGALLLGLYPSPVISQARKAMDQFQGVEGWMPFRGIELQPGGLNAEKAEPDEKAAPVSAPTVIGEADE
jgi:NADH-quinone oxidoreductase subunit N